MVCGSHPKTRAIYSTPPCPSLAASTAAYRRRSFSDSHPKNRCIFCSISAEYPSMPHSWIQNLLRGQDTTAQAIREVILDHILSNRLQESRCAAHGGFPVPCKLVCQVALVGVQGRGVVDCVQPDFCHSL